MKTGLSWLEKFYLEISVWPFRCTLPHFIPANEYRTSKLRAAIFHDIYE